MDTSCSPFQWNADFYGLGIRIGICPQWISAWGILDADSISVFAVAIATIITAWRNAAVIKMYIMLRILLGFPITTLSPFGIRPWIMNPSRLGRLIDILSDYWKERKINRRRRKEERDWVKRHRQAESDERRAQRQQTSIIGKLVDWLPLLAPIIAAGPEAGFLYMLWKLPKQLPLQFMSSLKLPGLSWTGVFWRTVTVTLVAGYNMAYWLGTNGHGVQQPRDDDGGGGGGGGGGDAAQACGAPIVFDIPQGTHA
ncbi:hypothetical protein B0T24DRAFT_684551 [Lasiosphaeria ovina]|uniref:Uncharacterized protein n=1 Tax=Lasiosphaeria ovina TaxID=92902 RepID=A0AAE0MYY5_9PEZI|nr:hypothetical protein B0T24DRAFT_684551 [Lasiosphaeria ovina]